MTENGDGTGRGLSLPLKFDPALVEVNERLSPAFLAPDQEFSRL